MQDIKLTKRGEIFVSLFISIFVILAIFLALFVVAAIMPDEKVGSDQIHISCVNGTVKQPDGTCTPQEIN